MDAKKISKHAVVKTNGWSRNKRKTEEIDGLTNPRRLLGDGDNINQSG